MLIAAYAVYVRLLLGNSATRPPVPAVSPAPVVLRLEPAPPLAEALGAMRGHPVLFFQWSPFGRLEDSLPLLNRCHRGYAAKGLEVIGLYRGPRTPELEARLRDAGVEWRVFHEAPGAPMAEWRERFKVTCSPGAVLVSASGEHVFAGGMWDLAKAMEQHLGPATVVAPVIVPVVHGRLLHAGRPASEFTDDRAQFGPFRDESVWRFVPADFRVEYDNRTGEFRVFNVPEGNYGVYITCGPFWHNFRTFTAVGRGARPVEFTLWRRIYLREPVDTSKNVLPAEECRHRSPVTFAWDPVPGAEDYLPNLQRRRLGVAESVSESIPLAPLKETRLAVEIEEGWEYEFGLTARARTAIVAHLSVYQAGLGNTYRFREGEPRVEREEHEPR